MKRVAWLLCGLCIAFGGMPALAATADRPGLEVTTLDGNKFELSAQRGQWVIVNFWATWCGPCIGEMPALSAFVSKHDNVTAIGLAWQDSQQADIRAFLKKHPVRYPIAVADPLVPPGDFDPPRVLPTTYLIAPDGHIARTFTGPLRMLDLERAIDPQEP